MRFWIDSAPWHLQGGTFCTAPGSRLATDPATFSAASSRSMAADRCRSHACDGSVGGFYM